MAGSRFVSNLGWISYLPDFITHLVACHLVALIFVNWRQPLTSLCYCVLVVLGLNLPIFHMIRWSVAMPTGFKLWICGFFCLCNTLLRQDFDVWCIVLVSSLRLVYVDSRHVMLTLLRSDLPYAFEFWLTLLCTIFLLLEGWNEKKNKLADKIDCNIN